MTIRNPVDWQNDGHYLEIFVANSSQGGFSVGLDAEIVCPFESDPNALCQRSDLTASRVDADWYRKEYPCWVRSAVEHLNSKWVGDRLKVMGQIQIEWHEILWKDPGEDDQLSLQIRQVGGQ